MWPQHGVNHHCDVFGGGVDVGELGYIQVEVLVVEVIEHMLLDGGGQHAKVDDIANLWIHCTTDAHDEFVVVAMEIGVVAFAVNARIVCIAHRWVVDAVRGIEMLMAVDRNTWGAGSSHVHLAGYDTGLTTTRVSLQHGCS